MSALRQPTTFLTAYQPALQGLGVLDINYHELQCLEMAVTVLLTQLDLKAKRPSCFHALRDYHVRNIQYWLSNQSLKAVLRLDGNNRVLWPVVSSEDVIWLMAALKMVTEETLIAMASDDANFEHDMSVRYIDDEQELALLDSECYAQLCSFYSYYRHIAGYRTGLMGKLHHILMH